MRQEVVRFVNSWDICQKTKPVNRKGSADRIKISGLFHRWCIDFAGPLPQTNIGNQYLIAAVEQMSKWPVAWAMPADLFDSLGVMEFKKEIIILFGPAQYILSNNGPKFDCNAVQHWFNIQRKCTSTYNLQGDCVVERMVGTLKNALQKVT